MATLKPWQKLVIDYIEKHEDFVNSGELLSLSNYEKNLNSRVQMGLPKGEGQTFLAAYLACIYPSALIYKDMAHWKDIKNSYKMNDNDIHKDTLLISAFEIDHCILSSMGKNSRLNEIKEKVANKKVVVIDNATEIMETFPRLIEWLFTVSNGIVILLG